MLQFSRLRESKKVSDHGDDLGEALNDVSESSDSDEDDDDDDDDDDEDGGDVDDEAKDEDSKKHDVDQVKSIDHSSFIHVQKCRNHLSFFLEI
jgi:hypothetical protein